MLVRFLWGDGKLDYAAPHLNHVNLVQRTARPHPANFTGGLYDFVTGAFADVYGSGVHPDERELRFMLEQEAMKYEDRERYAADVEDTEPEFNLSFLEDPHDELYPCAWENDTMRPKAKEAIKNHVMDVIHKGGFADADEWIYFTVFGSGASFNWDEDGDFDVQMWVDIDKYNNTHDTPMTSDDLVKDVRTLVQTVNFPSFADLNLEVPDCEGKMLIQFYPQPGTGSKDENLAKKPYACYDMETNEWLLHPKPYTSDFYGTHFLAIQSKAQDIATQAEGLIDELQRNVLNFQFWSGLWNKYKTEDYQDAATKSQDAAELQKEGIATLFEGVFGGRVEAYSPTGEGIDDERDATQKLLEVWGIFQKLKHYARAPLPWDEQELPEEPKESMWREAADDSAFDDIKQGRSFGFVNGHLIVGQSHHQAIMGAMIKKGWTWEQLMEAEQCWGWFQPSTTAGQVYKITVRFSSDAGFQHAEAEEKCLKAFKALFPTAEIVREEFHKGVEDATNKEYGSGLAGKPNVDHYISGDGPTYLNTQTPIPDPPDVAPAHEQLSLLDHPNPGGGMPPPKKIEPVPFAVGNIALITSGPEAGQYVTIKEPLDSDGDLWISHTDGSGGYLKPSMLKDLGPPKSASFHKLADWTEIMDKARRLRNDQQVTITNNQPDHVTGTVQGDHGTYQTEIWRDDPQSQAITMWNCECPWSQFSWGRTRSWKKYEGRPCAHTLALFWAAQQQAPAATDQGAPQQTAPAQTPPVPGPGGAMVPQQGLISPVPIPNVTLPLAPNQGIPPSGGPQPEGAPMGAPPGPPAYSVPTTPQNAQGVVKIPGALSHVAANQIVDIGRGDPFYNWQGKSYTFDPFFDGKKRKGLNYLLDGEVVGSITYTIASDHVYLESAYVDPGLHSSGIFSRLMEEVRQRYPGLHITGGWDPDSPLNGFADKYNYRVGATVFENGQHVRNKYEVIGDDTTTSIKYTVPQNSAGTVLYSDGTETVVIFPLKGSYHSPHLVKVEGFTFEFYADESVNPFIRRRSFNTSL